MAKKNNDKNTNERTRDDNASTDGTSNEGGQPVQTQNIDVILRDWPYDPSAVSVRLTDGDDGREVIQMRVEMGVLQLETAGRPDGERPEKCDTYFDHLIKEEIARGEEFALSEDECIECDREFVQFYHRRVCWLALQQYNRSVVDADHTLGLMDLCRRHAPDEDWALSHEQSRPFVMYHRIQAGAMAHIVDDNAESAIQAINSGLDSLRDVFAEQGLDDHYEDDELVARLVELREQLRDQFDIGKTLQERLAEAVAAEQYELAANLRDEMANRHKRRHR